MTKTKQEHINELSQKIFGKDAKDIKYLMVTDFIHKGLLEENLNRSGLYNWIQTFDGKISIPGDVKDYNEFDIVHINMSKQDRYLPSHIRRKLNKDGKTILICNNDYTTELWEGVMEHPDIQRKYYEDADLLFGTEYFQCTALSEITGGKVYNLPHPTNTERLKTMMNPDKKGYIAVLWRRYDKFAHVPFLAARDCGLQTVLVGYDRSQDAHWHITESMYDHVVYHTDYDAYLKILNEAALVYNPYTLHSYDRSGVDCAALGIPIVGSDRTWAMRQCYPKTMCDVYDVRKTKEMIQHILSDSVFYDKVCKYAQHKARYFSQEDAKLRLLNSIVDVKEGTDIKGVIEYADGFGESKEVKNVEASTYTTDTGLTYNMISNEEIDDDNTINMFDNRKKQIEYSTDVIRVSDKDTSWYCNKCNTLMRNGKDKCKCLDPSKLYECGSQLEECKEEMKKNE